MSRPARQFWAILLAVLTPLAGCTPSRSFYFHEDGDLSHYKGVATEMAYPDVETCRLPEVGGAMRPPTLRNLEDYQMWDLCLQDAVKTSLVNGKVVRLLRGGTGGTTDSLLTSPDVSPTVYDPALVHSNPGVGGRIGGGVESALSAFDAQFTTSMLWGKTEQPRNVGGAAGNLIFAKDFLQDSGTFQAEISKTAAPGTSFAVRNNTVYDWNNSPTREVPSDWSTNFEAEARQPFLQGAGTMFNRIAGPGLGVGNYNGVVIARINNDISLADFEGQVLNHVKQVEDTYWDLYLSYRVLDAARDGRDSALRAWRAVKAKADVGSVGGGTLNETLARQQYFEFRARVEQNLCNLYAVENRLRYLMGLAATDGRLIRPCDEPTTARVEFDWCQIHEEALIRQVNLRRQKWAVKRAEMQLIAARNFLLPRLDGVARYRWLGLGDDLLDPNGRGILQPNDRAGTIPGSNAFSTLTDGHYQEWEMGLEFSMPIGFRRELAGVRHAQLTLARERTVLQEQELEVSHLLTESLRNLECNYALSETNFNRRIASDKEVKTAEVINTEVSTTLQDVPDPLNRLLDALRRRADSDSAYYSSLVSYVKSIAEVHFRKGSLLEYNSIFLAEGPWPAKAYCDAHERARERDAGHYLNYGYTRPDVYSRGPTAQDGFLDNCPPVDGTPTLAPGGPEMIPTPAPGQTAPPMNQGLPQPEPATPMPPAAVPMAPARFGEPSVQNQRSTSPIAGPGFLAQAPVHNLTDNR